MASRLQRDLTTWTRRLLLVAAVAAGASPGPASAWWNGEWTGRKQLQLDTSAAGINVTEPIGATAVLIRLHTGNFRFEAAKEDGSDLRFVAGDDKTPLKHHLERYESLLGEALIWVGLPELKPGAKTDLWLYYGNPKATAADDLKGTYDPATALVYHFTDRGQPPHDASASANHAATAGVSVEGALIGRGLKLDGATTVSIPASPSLAWGPGARITWSAWVKPEESSASGAIFARRQGALSFLVGLDAGRPFVEVDGGSGPQRIAAATALVAGSWHHLAVTGGDAVGLYLDGVMAAKVAVPLPRLDGPAVLGGDDATVVREPPVRTRRSQPVAPPAGPMPGLRGELDELELAKVERPVGFILAAAISQGTNPGKFLVAGPEEEAGGMGSGYLAVILRSVTLDGWVIIGVLLVMAVVSWLVMWTKAAYLATVEKANRQFSEAFGKQSTDLLQLILMADPKALGEEKALQRSPLYRIYRIGADEVRRRTHAGHPLTAEAIEAIRASLDSGLVREGQRLSRQMVLLTIAISGGPFLGLLGTVVGVMITFAAIAAAGDVNVNAIAPGIAAALVATVAGLAVAIPALFGYNWLLTRVKDATANHQVFVDEFVTKVAEAHAFQRLGDDLPVAVVVE
jgi:biopolymer transport protein ExbB